MVKCSKRLLFQKFAYPVFGSFYCYFFILLRPTIDRSAKHDSFRFFCLSFKKLMSVHLFTLGLSYFIKLQCFIKVRNSSTVPMVAMLNNNYSRVSRDCTKKNVLTFKELAFFIRISLKSFLKRLRTLCSQEYITK